MSFQSTKACLLAAALALVCPNITTWAQSKGNFTLTQSGFTLKDALDAIEAQSSYTFLIRNNDIDLTAPVEVNALDAGIDDVLSQILSDKGISYEINGTRISIFYPTNPQKKEPGRFILNGNIRDKEGEPIIGAGVSVNNGVAGAITDVNGSFSISVMKGDIIIISALGYASKTVAVQNNHPLEITLDDDFQMLDETIVIGYGTVRKGDVTGAISGVKSNAIIERGTQSLSSALQGQVAGLQVTRSSGEPGSSGSLVIRGVTTMSTNDPLIIIDGVPGSMDDVNPQDVESISILKDAASAAIYGSRAAAGVIIVSTKRANDNTFSFNYNYSFAIDKPTTKPSLGNAVDYFNILNEMRWNDGAGDEHSQYSTDYIDSYLANNISDPYHYPNTNWMDEVLKKTVSHQEHNFSVTGGQDNLKTKFAFNYQTADGYYAQKKFDRYNGRLNNDWQVTPWLHAALNIDFTYTDKIAPASGNPIRNTYIMPPIYGPYWKDGTYADVKDGTNILAAVNEAGFANTDLFSGGGKVQIDIRPINGLTITGAVAPRFSFTKIKTFTKAVRLYYEDGRPLYHQSFNTNNLYEARDDTQSVTWQAFSNYNKRWGAHSLNAMAGYEGYAHNWEDLGASRLNYTLSRFPYLNIGPENYQYNNGEAGHNAYHSYFGRIIYSYNNRYILQANLRADASSRFAKAHRWGYFPSVSAGWVVSEEPWFNFTPVSYLKLRASIGKLGNDRIGSEFPYQASIVFGNQYLYNKSTGNVSAVQTAYQKYYAFNDITWETTTTYGFGLDASFLAGRLRFTGDIYKKETENMLLTLGFPSYAGFSAPKQNAGQMHTRGWDLELSWNDKIGDLTYGLSANLSDYRSKMGYVGDTKTVNGNYLIEEGSYFQEWYMLQSAGLFQSNEELLDDNGNRVPTYSSNDTAGDIRYIDQNGDGTINGDDKVRLGNSLPELIYGGNLFVGFKGFDFSLAFQGVGRQQVLYQSTWYQPIQDGWGSVPSLLLGNYWSKYNTEEQNQNVKYPRVTSSNIVSQTAGSDYWLFNGAYFRVKSVVFGYTLPSQILSHTFIKNLRVYFNITDLPAISRYPKGWDPELGSYNFTSSEYNNFLDYFSTSFIFGVNVKF